MAMNIDESITLIEQEKIHPVSDESIKEIFSVIKSQDNDMSILLDMMLRLIIELEDQNKKTLYMTKVLKFYGFNSNDILATRQRIVIEDGMLVKTPFLKNKQKELIQMLLDQLEVKVL
jgi:hypothetical protein